MNRYAFMRKAQRSLLTPARPWRSAPHNMTCQSGSNCFAWHKGISSTSNVVD